MKYIAGLIAAAALANASPFPAVELEGRSCSGNNCLRAIRGSPEDVANMFCSAVLSKVPATDIVTVTQTATVTAYATLVETATDHVITGTATVTGAPVVLNKRKTSAYSDYTSHFTSQCSYVEDKITSACGCYLADAATSTVTVYQTVDATVTGTTVTSTATTTVEVDEIATVTAHCTAAPTNAIQNGDFETAIGANSPWSVVDVYTGASWNLKKDASHGDSTYTFHGTCQNRPNSGAYVGQTLQQTITTCPGVTYKVSWYIRATGDRDNSYAFVYVDGTPISQINQLPKTSYGNYEVSFTATDHSTVMGFGMLEVGWESGEFYFDNISITPVTATVTPQ